MAEFKYKAIDASGEKIEGSQEAKDRYALARALRGEDKTLITAELVGVDKGKKGFQDVLNKVNNVFARVKTREKIIFARNLSAMLHAGLSLSRALSIMERQTKNKFFKEILVDVGGQVKKGIALSNALAEHPKIFPQLFIAMVRAGEESGKLADALSSLSDQLDKIDQLKRRIRGAMIYPSIVISVMVIVGIVMLIFVVPTLTGTFEELGVDLPITTQIIVGVSNFIQTNTALFLGMIVGLIFAFIIVIRTEKGKRALQYIFLRTPVIGAMVKETNSARTARTLSSLLVSGVEVVHALSITKDVVQNVYYKEVVEEADKQIQQGSQISDIFIKREDLYPVLVGEMMAVGEEAGNLPEMLENVADFYEEEVAEKTKNLSTIIEPILMVIIGIVVGFFALSMISPIYSISSSI